MSGSRICVRGREGVASEILPTSHSKVGSAAKIWVSILGVGGGGSPPGPP